MRLVFRPMIASDRVFIASSWQLNWSKPAEVSLLSQAAWRHAVFESVQWLANLPGVQALVVADADAKPGDADVFGYLVTYERADEPLPLVLFLFVKPGARRAGLATKLLRRVGLEPDAPIPYACHTKMLTILREAGKFPNAQWRPELGRMVNPHQGRPDERDHAPDHEAPGREADPRAEAGGPDLRR